MTFKEWLKQKPDPHMPTNLQFLGMVLTIPIGIIILFIVLYITG